jgi:hypothetical protein
MLRVDVAARIVDLVDEDLPLGHLYRHAGCHEQPFGDELLPDHLFRLRDGAPSQIDPAQIGEVVRPVLSDRGRGAHIGVARDDQG